jgi:hypothetical protein
VPRIVTLSVFNDSFGCTGGKRIKITLKSLKAKMNITTKQPICKNDVVSFNSISSIGNIGGQYFWDFGDGAKDSLRAYVFHKYKKTGNFKARLIVVSVDSCRDTTSVLLKVNSPNLDYTLKNPVFCDGDSLFIANTSMPSSKVRFYEWRFDSILVSRSKDLNMKLDFTPKYINPNKIVNVRSFKLTLYAKDSAGCREWKKSYISLTDKG